MNYIHIGMNISFTLFLACNRNNLMIGQIRTKWWKKPNYDGDSPNVEYEFLVLIKW